MIGIWHTMHLGITAVIESCFARSSVRILVGTATVLIEAVIISSVPQKKSGIVCLLGHDHVFPNPFKFITQRSSWHSTLNRNRNRNTALQSKPPSHTHTHKHTHSHTQTHTNTQKNTHTDAHPHAHTLSLTHKHAHNHAYKHTHTHTQTHTHI
jgi:type IV secretory pathway VirJ component